MVVRLRERRVSCRLHGRKGFRSGAADGTTFEVRDPKDDKQDNDEGDGEERHGGEARSGGYIGRSYEVLRSFGWFVSDRRSGGKTLDVRDWSLLGWFRVAFVQGLGKDGFKGRHGGFGERSRF